MSKKNFTISTVATAPSPATSGTSLVVASGDGSLFAVNEPAIIFPVNDQPLVANAEIVMVTNVATDTLTITRTQESTSARTIVAGDIIIQGITAKDWNDLVTLVAGKITAFADPNADRIVFWDDSVGAFAALTASTGLTLSGTNLTVRAASEAATGIVERATDAEFTNGTDTTRFVNAKQVASVSQTMTNKTLTSPVIDTGVSGTAVLDEDNMASDSATQLATQQSIKAYVDSKGFTWKGAWATSTSYAVNDTVESNGSGYVCTSAHTSGASTESGVGASWATVWDLFVEGTNKTMPTGDIVGTTDTQTLTNKTLTSPLFGGTIDGWISAGETWTYASADDPTYTFTIASDVTGKYSAGMKIKWTQTTVRYGIITAVSAFSGGNTTITLYGGTDYDLDNAAITSPYYSMVKAPQGFPLDPSKWRVRVTDTGNRTQATATQNVWYNLGTTNSQISVPIGVWRLRYKVFFYITNNEVGKVTLSTANNTESDTSMSGYIFGTMEQLGSPENIVNVASKTVYYLNALKAGAGAADLFYYNTYTPMLLEATCAYL